MKARKRKQRNKKQRINGNQKVKRQTYAFTHQQLH